MADRNQQTEQHEQRPDGDEHTIEDLDVLDSQAGEVKGGDGSITLNYTHVEQTYKSQ